MKYLIIFSILTISLGSCKKDPVISGTDYLIFGEQCGWNTCNDFFKIQNGNLYNSSDYFHRPLEMLNFDATPLSNYKYHLATNLQSIPNYMINHPNKSLDCAGCSDGSLFYIERKQNNTVEYWITDGSGGDSELRDYIQQMYNTIQLLR
jgi:hypothetical protein